MVKVFTKKKLKHCNEFMKYCKLPLYADLKRICETEGVK